MAGICLPHDQLELYQKHEKIRIVASAATEAHSKCRGSPTSTAVVATIAQVRFDLDNLAVGAGFDAELESAVKHRRAGKQRHPL